MKKFMLKTRLGLLVLLGVLAFGLAEAAAQQLPQQTQDISWVSTDNAILVVNQVVGDLDQQLLTLPNTALELKHKFFESINVLLLEGETVPVALQESYFKFVADSSDMPVEVPNDLPLTTWQDYYNEAAQMLQN